MNESLDLEAFDATVRSYRAALSKLLVDFPDATLDLARSHRLMPLNFKSKQAPNAAREYRFTYSLCGTNGSPVELSYALTVRR